MQTIEYIISELSKLNYDVVEGNIDSILKNKPVYDKQMIAVEESDSDYTNAGDSPYMYEIDDSYEVGIFVQNYDSAISTARLMKNEVIHKISTMELSSRPFFMRRIRREKNNDTNVGAFIIEVIYNRFSEII